MWFNPFIRFLLRSPLHFMVSKNMMLMTFTGRKSGKSYTTPMNYLAVNGAVYTTSYRDRVWWRNLQGGADVILRLRGKDVPARAETVQDQPDLAISMRQYLESAPHLAKYYDVRINSDGQPDDADIAHITQNMVMVRTELKQES
jgi:deazaflavin-dependent oxidoreductase (nitroreductase family)